MSEHIERARTIHRRFRFHLIGPRPYGGTLHTSSAADVRRAVADGWTLYRLNVIPRRYWAG